ncbi:MAG: DUF2550 domain-containing protein [Actinomycetes bacterium]
MDLTTVTLVLLAVVVVGLTVAFMLRRRFLLSGLGAVTVWLRPGGSPRWSVGVAWYSGDVLLWYRGLSLAVRPQERFCRSELRVESRRSAGLEDLALPSDVVVLTCETADGRRDLAMDPSTVTGFLSWMESAPPGT